MKNHISLENAQAALKASGKEFSVLFEHGTLILELYKPDGIDNQKPHTRDEVYIIATGSGSFNLEGEVSNIKAGDFLFVPAQAAHHFFDFTDDFSTWVLFYGPDGGE